MRGRLRRSLAVHAPQVADRGHLDVVALQAGDDRGEFAAAIADADVAEADAIVRADDASVGDGGGPRRAGPARSSDRRLRSLLRGDEERAIRGGWKAAGSPGG